MSPDDPGRFRIMGANFHGFWIPGLDAIWGLSFSAYRGIFTYSPVLIPAMYILFKRLRNPTDPYRYDWIIISAGFFLQFLFNSAMIDFWSGGYVFGPRYLMPIIPFLMIPLGLAFQEMPFRLMIVLGGLSLLINWAGVQYIVSQSAFGSIAVFILSGPTTQLYQFLDKYFKTYGEWDIAISPAGGFLLLGVALTLFWKYSWSRNA
jgi:hypothetical protein